MVQAFGTLATICLLSQGALAAQEKNGLWTGTPAEINMEYRKQQRKLANEFGGLAQLLALLFGGSPGRAKRMDEFKINLDNVSDVDTKVSCSKGTTGTDSEGNPKTDEHKYKFSKDDLKVKSADYFYIVRLSVDSKHNFEKETAEFWQSDEGKKSSAVILDRISKSDLDKETRGFWMTQSSTHVELDLNEVLRNSKCPSGKKDSIRIMYPSQDGTTWIISKDLNYWPLWLKITIGVVITIFVLFGIYKIYADMKKEAAGEGNGEGDIEAGRVVRPARRAPKAGRPAARS